MWDSVVLYATGASFFEVANRDVITSNVIRVLQCTVVTFIVATSP